MTASTDTQVSWELDRRWTHPAIWLLATYVIGEIGWILRRVFQAPTVPIHPAISILLDRDVPPLDLVSLLMIVPGVLLFVFGSGEVRHLWAKRRGKKGQLLDGAARAVLALWSFGAAAWWYWVAKLPIGAFSPSALGVCLAGGLVGWLAYVGLCQAERHGDFNVSPVIRGSEDDLWIEILRRVDFLGCRVLDHRDHAAGYSLTIASGPEHPASARDVDTKLNAITVHASHALRTRGIVLPAGAVRVEEAEAAYEFILHVTIHGDVLKEDIPYPVDEPVRSIKDGLNLGLYEDRTPIDLTVLRGHVRIVGCTGSGKSTLLEVLTGQVTRCSDAMLWVATTDKLTPLVYPWLKPWFEGKTSRPVLDYVAGQEPREVLRMLALAYRVMRERNARVSNTSDVDISPSQPAIIILIEEAADVLERRDKITTFDGQTMNASKLVSEIARGGRSAGVVLVTANQYALVETYGDSASKVNRNFTVRICLKTVSYYDGSATLVGLSNVDTTKLKHFSMYVQPNIGEMRAIPAKSFLISDDAFSLIAVRNSSNVPSLEPGMATLLGEDYADRWSAARLPELFRACTDNNLTWPGSTTPSSDDEFQQIIAANRLEEIVQTDVKPGRGNRESSTVLAELDESYERQRTLIERIAAKGTGVEGNSIPEPLATIVDKLNAENAPKDFVSTRQLAIVLGRVSPDASEDEKHSAAQKLGKELSLLVPGLNAHQARVGGTQRRQGYSPARLKDAARSCITGEPLAPENVS